LVPVHGLYAYFGYIVVHVNRHHSGLHQNVGRPFHIEGMPVQGAYLLIKCRTHDKAHRLAVIQHYNAFNFRLAVKNVFYHLPFDFGGDGRNLHDELLNFPVCIKIVLHAISPRKHL
jgi:hypothetical protein